MSLTSNLPTDGDREPLVVASIGHSFPDLSIETKVFEKAGVTVVNESAFKSGAMSWDRVSAVLVGTQLQIDAARLASMPHCRAVVRYGIGVDNVDLDAARGTGIIVSNVTNYCAEEVALHALSMALSLMRGLPHWDRTVRAGQWRGVGRPKSHRPSSMNLGIVGFGQIGRMLARQANGIFGSILVYDPWVEAAKLSATSPDFTAVSSLDEILTGSDVISFHVPLTPLTQNLVGTNNVHLLKPGCILINVSRGGLVNEDLLLNGLESGQIGGVGLDTFEQEPLAKDSRFIGSANTLLSPHMAWFSDAAEIDLRRLAAEEVVRVLSGQEPLSRVA